VSFSKRLFFSLTGMLKSRKYTKNDQKTDIVSIFEVTTAQTLFVDRKNLSRFNIKLNGHPNALRCSFLILFKEFELPLTLIALQ